MDNDVIIKRSIVEELTTVDAQNRGGEACNRATNQES